MKPTYSTSTGERLTTNQIDNRVRKAKEEKFYNLEYGFCETCNRSGGIRLDMSHLISVKECKESSRVELAYDLNNIILECSQCHNKTEKQSKRLRQKRYEKNKH